MQDSNEHKEETFRKMRNDFTSTLQLTLAIVIDSFTKKNSNFANPYVLYIL